MEYGRRYQAESDGGRAGRVVDEAGCSQLDSLQAEDMIRNADALLVDVREPREYVAGSIPDSKLIPLSRIGYEIRNLRRHADRPIILGCRSGRRSELVCRLLKENGFAEVYNLAGGIEAWKQAERPLES